MNFDKELKNLGIIPLKEITKEEKKYIVEQISEKMKKTFPKINITYEEILNSAKMERAQINGNLGKISYFYKNKTIYFEKKLDAKEINENIVHECIHYIQDKRKENENLNQLGLCVFEEFKVRGMALNEIGINYITNKIFNKYEKSKTHTLLKQMILITGEDDFLDSILNNSNKFEETFMERTNTEFLYYKIQKKLDLMFDLEQIIKRLFVEGKMSKKPQKYFNKINKYKHNLNKIFSELQWEIYSMYFSRKIELLDKLEEIEEYKNELFDFGQWLDITEDEYQYTNFTAQKLEKLNKIEREICKRNSNNSMVVFNENPIYRIVRTVRKIIFKPKEYETDNKN